MPSTTMSASTSVTWVQWVYVDFSSSSTTVGPIVTTTNADTWTTWMHVRTQDIDVSERERRWSEIERERQKAKERALKLLRASLSDRQWEQFQANRFFEVIGPDGRTRYAIYQGRSANVYRLDETGKPLKRLCIHPRIDCPDEDTMLAQKLMIETNPLEFERIANHHPLDERSRMHPRVSLAA
jgi:hypothetical protein